MTCRKKYTGVQANGQRPKSTRKFSEIRKSNNWNAIPGMASAPTFTFPRASYLLLLSSLYVTALSVITPSGPSSPMSWNGTRKVGWAETHFYHLLPGESHSLDYVLTIDTLPVYFNTVTSAILKQKPGHIALLLNTFGGFNLTRSKGWDAYRGLWAPQPLVRSACSLTSFAAALLSPPGQMAALMFLRSTRHGHSMEPCTCSYFSLKTFPPLFFYTTCCLTSFRPLLKCYLSKKAFPDGYDVATLSSYQISFSILLPHAIYNIFNYSFTYCLLPQ